ncbi:uncharacterized protein A4U43_C09F9630 [Asparagus officinalis]|uniref:Protein ENHANCED DISEASE RESISTANCE 2 C-terminal domain-containing protein n=1 Tax=Asparagus officinalis TaxID=4686 RepID=A0A5P1E6E5_ASPOF|nr:uncharacterized protein A4U43_C09F9630 [Asparagus officinalis]
MIDMRFVVEAQEEEELPERLIGAVRIAQMELSSATFLETPAAAPKAAVAGKGTAKHVNVMGSQCLHVTPGKTHRWPRHRYDWGIHVYIFIKVVLEEREAINIKALQRESEMLRAGLVGSLPTLSKHML